MHLHLLLVARSWPLSRGSLWLQQPVAAFGFLFPSPGTSHQENLSRKLGMEETTRVMQTPKAQTQLDHDRALEGHCLQEPMPFPLAGQDGAVPWSTRICSKLPTLTGLFLSFFLLQVSVTAWKESRHSL